MVRKLHLNRTEGVGERHRIGDLPTCKSFDGFQEHEWHHHARYTTWCLLLATNIVRLISSTAVSLVTVVSTVPQFDVLTIEEVAAGVHEVDKEERIKEIEEEDGRIHFEK